MNPPDNYALEEALILKEKIGEGEVVIVSMGLIVFKKSFEKGWQKVQTEVSIFSRNVK